MNLARFLRTGDEDRIFSELDLLAWTPSWTRGLWTISREEALSLIERGGNATRAALSNHPDGRVREAALRALEPEGGATLLALLARANDWVPVVARLAGERALAALPKADDAELLRALPFVHALTRQSRMRHGFLIDAYVKEVERRRGLARRLRKAYRNGPMGVWAFRNLAGAEESRETIARESLGEAPPSVQLLAARALIHDPASWPILMASPNPMIRRIGLDIAPSEARAEALTDLHAGVRNDARYLLGKRDYALFYRAALPEPGAISGLGETGTRNDAESLRPLLAHPKAERRRRAIEAFGRLLGAEAESELRTALKDPSRKVQRAAVEAMGGMAIAFEAEEVATMDLGPREAWTLMRRTRRWDALLAVLRHVETFPKAEAWLLRWTISRDLHPQAPRGQEASVALVLLEERGAGLDPGVQKRIGDALRTRLG